MPRIVVVERRSKALAIFYLQAATDLLFQDDFESHGEESSSEEEQELIKQQQEAWLLEQAERGRARLRALENGAQLHHASTPDLRTEPRAGLEQRLGTEQRRGVFCKPRERVDKVGGLQA